MFCEITEQMRTGLHLLHNVNTMQFLFADKKGIFSEGSFVLYRRGIIIFNVNDNQGETIL